MNEMTRDGGHTKIFRPLYGKSRSKREINEEEKLDKRQEIQE